MGQKTEHLSNRLRASNTAVGAPLSPPPPHVLFHSCLKKKKPDIFGQQNMSTLMKRKRRRRRRTKLREGGGCYVSKWQVLFLRLCFFFLSHELNSPASDVSRHQKLGKACLFVFFAFNHLSILQTGATAQQATHDC